MKIGITIFFICLGVNLAKAQIDFTPFPGTDTHCPGEVKRYTASGNGCTSFTWTVTNGIFPDNDKTTITGSYADVKWNDVAKIGTLKLTANCGTADEPDIKEITKSYAIRSVVGQTPKNARKSNALPYCSTQAIALEVDIMYLDHTGGASGTNLQRVDGYEWKLPPGWSSNGSTGDVVTQAENITISPANGCTGGTVTVRGFIQSCGSSKSYSNSSAPINIDRIAPLITVTPPAGYSGSSCGTKEPVTFTVTALGCVQNYYWVFPDGWIHKPAGTEESPNPFFTHTNSITVTPSGNNTDSGNITVTVNLSCGTQLASSPYEVKYRSPVISSPAAICHQGNEVKLTNVAADVPVQWNVSGNLEVVSGQGTPLAVIKAKSATTKETGTISVVTACSGTPTPPKTVWLNQPLTPDITGPQTVVKGGYYIYNAIPFGTNPDLTTQGVGLYTGFQWFFSLRTGKDWRCYSSCTTYEPTIQAGSSSTYVSLKVENNCGVSGQRDYAVHVQQDDCPPGGCIEPFSVYPNPSTDLMTVEIADTETSLQNDGLAEISLIDAQGVTVFKLKTNDKVVKIPVQKFKNGLYYLALTRAGITTHRQVLIQH